jgi:hypothetical protein
MKDMKTRGEKSRRRFLKSLAAGSAAVITLQGLGKSKGQAGVATGQPTDVGSKGYRLTAHIRRYYNAAQF